MKKPQILLTNDDGIQSPGLWAAAEALSEIGFEKERLRMVNVSAAMGRPLADIIIDMVETVRKLGPNPLGQNSTSKKQETAL